MRVTCPAPNIARSSLALAAGGVIVLCMAPLPAAADPAACARIAEDAARLACYDAAFPPRAAQPASGSRSQWQSTAAASLLPGHSNRVVARESTDDIRCRWINPRPVKLVIQCKDNVTSVAFETGCYMTSSQYRSYGHVTYQLDDQPPRVADMVAGTDSRSLGFWSGDAAIPFLRELVGKARLAVKMTPYAEDPVSASFDLGGMAEAIAPVREECGW